MVSGVGADELGQRALQELSQRNVATEHVQQRREQTGFVNVSLDANGVASYEFAENAAWDNLEWTPALADLAAATDVVCFGTLGQRSSASAETIQRFINAVPRDALRICDINLRPPYFSDDVIRRSLEICNCVKLNDDELPVIAELLGLNGTPEDLIVKIAERCDLRTVVLTLGSNGAMLYDRGEVVTADGIDVKVVDTVGAGDSFTAATALGLLLEDVSPQAICQRACNVAAFVCSQSGATPSFPDELRIG